MVRFLIVFFVLVVTSPWWLPLFLLWLAMQEASEWMVVLVALIALWLASWAEKRHRGRMKGMASHRKEDQS